MCKNAFFFHCLKETIHGHSPKYDFVPPTIRPFGIFIRLPQIDLIFTGDSIPVIDVVVFANGGAAVLVVVDVVVEVLVIGL